MNKEFDVCEQCWNCYYFYENNDTENQCVGQEEPCWDFIERRQ